MAIHKLSALKVASLIKAGKPGQYGDGGKLYLQIAVHGSCTWIFRYRHAGKARAMGLGPAHSVSLAKAREAAAKARELVHAGYDPIAKRGAVVQAPTFDTCAREYIKHNRCWAEWHTQLTAYASPVIGHLPVNQIAISHVLQILTPIWHTKFETARKLRGKLEAVMDYAKRRACDQATTRQRGN
jgi:hypothetical protein